METLLAFKASFIPLVFVGGGLLFIFAAVVGKFHMLFDLSPQRQIVASVIGVLLIVSGIAPYFLAPSRQPLTSQVDTASAADFAAPLEITQPNTFIVDARVGWQTTDIAVEAGDQIRIQALEGEWSPWGGVAQFSAVGDTSYICVERTLGQRCNEPIGTLPIGMLIGRIGDYWFPIGEYNVITAETNGQLQLRINDSDIGLFDNSGSLLVRVSLGAQ